MKTKENKIKITLKTIIFLCFGFFAILYIIMFYNMYFSLNKSYAKETYVEPEQETKISNANEIDIEQNYNGKVEVVETIIIDINNSIVAEGFCQEVIYLIEPSIIKLEKLMVLNATALQGLRNKKIVLKS